MKLFNFFSLSLVLTNAIQIVSGFTCPSINAINSKIARNKPMKLWADKANKLPGLFWSYRDHNNKPEKYYRGEKKVKNFSRIDYQKPTESINESLTCTYKLEDKIYFSLSLARRGLAYIDAEALEQAKNWDDFYASRSLFTCEKYKNVDIQDCQVSLKKGFSR